MEDDYPYGLNSKGEKIDNMVGSDVEVTVEDYQNLMDLKFMDSLFPHPQEVVKTSVYRPNGSYRDEVSIKMKKISSVPLKPASSSANQTR